MELFKEQQERVKGIALKFYFLLRKILIRIYHCTGKSAPYLLFLMTMIIISSFFFCFFTFLKLFFKSRQGFLFVTSLCLFHDVQVT